MPGQGCMHVHAPLEAVMTRNWVTERHKEYTAPVGGQWPRQPRLCKERGVRMRGRSQDSGWPDCLAPGVSRRPHTEAAVNTCLQPGPGPGHRGHCRLFTCSHTMIIKYDHSRHDRPLVIEGNSVESYDYNYFVH